MVVDEPKVLRQLTDELRKDGKAEELLQRVVDHTSTVLEVTRVSAWLLDLDRTTLIAGARAGMPLHNKPDFHYRLGHGLVGWIAAHAEPIRTGAADADPRFLPRPGMVDKLGSFLGVPLVTEQRLHRRAVGGRSRAGVFFCAPREPAGGHRWHRRAPPRRLRARAGQASSAGLSFSQSDGQKTCRATGPCQPVAS